MRRDRSTILFSGEGERMCGGRGWNACIVPSGASISQWVLKNGTREENREFVLESRLLTYPLGALV